MGKMAGLAPGEIELIKTGNKPEDERLAALVGAARLVREKRGKLTTDDLKQIEFSGIVKSEIYELIMLIANKVIPTYINHIAGTRIDREFS